MKYTLLLFLICTLVFVMQLSNPEITKSLVLSSSNLSALFTYMFAHLNLFHFLINMFGLIAFGNTVEEIFSYKMPIIFVLSGIVSGLFSLPFYGGVIGASGAIYGLLGIAALLRPERITSLGIIGVPTPLIMVALIYAIFDIVGIFIYTGVASIVHLTGLLVGIVFAIANREHVAPA